MNPSALTSSQDVAKAPTTLDKIPEDVQLAIIKCIQSWKKSEGTKQEREKGKRARDSALRSVALSCRRTFSIYQPQLLLDVTLNFSSLFNFYLLLARNFDARKFVRSISFTPKDDITTQEQFDEAEKDLQEVQEDLDEIFEALTAQKIKVDAVIIGVECVVEGVFRFLPNIQTLVIQQSALIFPLRSSLANARLAPVPFLTHSLRKLFIPMWGSVEDNLKAKNLVWILVFCTGLRLASLGCIFDKNDFKYLSEFSETFSGLSKVQKLALGVDFAENESIERYWDREVGKQWIGGNQKNEAMFKLLEVTKNLECLEISYMSANSEEETRIDFSCLSALRSSYLSLKSVRLFNLGVNQDDPEEFKANSNLSLFEEVRLMTLNPTMLVLLGRISEFKFPPGLKVLYIPYYNSQNIQEDIALARALKVKSFPSLEKIIIPSTRIFNTGTQADSDDPKGLWLEGCRELEKAEIFQSGKVKLRFVEPGGFIGESSEIDFMSILTWLSPP